MPLADVFDVLCRYAGLQARLQLGRTSQFPFKRDHAFTDGSVVTVAPKMLHAPLHRQLGVLMHELGHVALIQGGQPEHSEREADAAAERLFGVPVYYDAEDVQSALGGHRPRPSWLAR